MLDTTHDIFLVTFNLEIFFFFLSNVVNLFSISLQKFCQATKILVKKLHLETILLQAALGHSILSTHFIVDAGTYR